MQIHELHDVTSMTVDVMKRSKDNVVNFINTLLALEFPSSGIFSCADLESTGWEDRRGHGQLWLPVLHARVRKSLLSTTILYQAMHHARLR